jgi:hypothetical protein
MEFRDEGRQAALAGRQAFIKRFGARMPPPASVRRFSLLPTIVGLNPPSARRSRPIKHYGEARFMGPCHGGSPVMG